VRLNVVQVQVEELGFGRVSRWRRGDSGAGQDRSLES